jgi:uncharacterized protein YdaU (DUF1376 family)
MNYFDFHIGDYAEATAHLSFVEDAAYMKLLRKYYALEAPLPLDIKATQRLVGARTKEEKDAVQAMLEEFFSKTDEGWRNRRADLVIEKYVEKRGKAAKSASARWDAMRTHSEGNAFALPSHCDGNAPSPSPSPSKDQKLSSPAGDCPHAEILEAYHELLPANPRMKVWAGKREAALRSRWREDPKRQSLDYWRRFFAHVAASPFLTGQVNGSNGRPFLPGLDWLVLPENFAKVIEGRYHDRS